VLDCHPAPAVTCPVYAVLVCTTPCTKGWGCPPSIHTSCSSAAVLFPAKNPATHKKVAVRAVVRPPALHGNRLGVLGAAWRANCTRPPLPCLLSPQPRLHHLLPLGTPQHVTNPSQTSPHRLNTGGCPVLNSTCTRHPGSPFPNTRHALHNHTQPWLPGPCWGFPMGPHAPTHTSGQQKAAQLVIATSPAATTRVSGGRLSHNTESYYFICPSSSLRGAGLQGQ
jgi:hypothetical protein